VRWAPATLIALGAAAAIGGAGAGADVCLSHPANISTIAKLAICGRRKTRLRARLTMGFLMVSIIGFRRAEEGRR
jgi:hypothetical protein